jgi:hypothetical protein
VTEGGGFVRFVRLALNVVMQNDVGLRGSNPAIPPGLTFKKFNVLPTQCMYVFCTDLSTNIDYFLILH